MSAPEFRTLIFVNEKQQLIEVEVDEDSAMVEVTVHSASQVTIFTWTDVEAEQIAAALAEAAPLAKAANEAPAGQQK